MFFHGRGGGGRGQGLVFISGAFIYSLGPPRSLYSAGIFLIPFGHYTSTRIPPSFSMLSPTSPFLQHINLSFILPVPFFPNFSPRTDPLSTKSKGARHIMAMLEPIPTQQSVLTLTPLGRHALALPVLPPTAPNPLLQSNPSTCRTLYKLQLPSLPRPQLISVNHTSLIPLFV